jgi:hypothetical protein
MYFGSKYPTAIGGAVRLDNHLFGTTRLALLCVEYLSGQLKWEERSVAPGSVVYADGCLYLHGENGEVALVEATVDGYREKGRFTPPNQPDHSGNQPRAWTYPVIANGRLYLRDQSILSCYDVKGSPP